MTVTVDVSAARMTADLTDGMCKLRQDEPAHR